jgi:D-alanyl-D-alanine carboxypeptidase
MRRPFLLLALASAAPASAQTDAVAAANRASLSSAPAPRSPVAAPIAAPAPPDGRLFGHFPYVDVGASGLILAPPGFALGQPCRVQPAVADALVLLLAAKAGSGVPGALHGLSCYRSVAHQRSVFCRPGKNCRDPAARSRAVAPPGYSEHETGYAIDFAVRPAPGCPDTSDCIARTPAGAWLLGNAARFGFELSFPQGNAQGVTWEPWHWRWVGVIGEAPGAPPARRLFAGARTRFPAAPAVVPLAIRVAQVPPITLGVLGTPTPPPLAKLPKGKRRRR